MAGYKTEANFLDKVEEYLQRCECKTWREVIPDACKDWARPYQVDLIFYRDDIGYIGVEGKNINTLGQGSIIANAVKQIEDKYRNQTYFDGKIIDRWCVAVPTDPTEFVNKRSSERITMFLKHFLWKMYNISVLEYTPADKKLDGRVSIDINTKRSIIFEARIDHLFGGVYVR